MQSIAKLVSFCFLAFVLCLLGAVPALADTVYTYSGNPFSNFSGTDACSAGIGECSLQGWFAVASPLAADLTNAAITPESFSFTDGGVTITNLTVNPDPAGPPVFDISTGPDGDISSWLIGFNNATYPQVYGAQYTAICTSSNGPQSCLGPGFTAGDSTDIGVSFVGGTPGMASVANNPGTWTVPEPSSFLMIGSEMLAALGMLSRKRLVGGLRSVQHLVSAQRF
ncbi:MAG: hypothetical protein ACRD2U_01090 [Terriglobales bacterium]